MRLPDKGSLFLYGYFLNKIQIDVKLFLFLQEIESATCKLIKV